MKLDPECFKDDNLFFLKASGQLYPCCYISSNPEARTFLGTDLTKQLNVNDYSFEEITNSEAWAKLKESMLSDKPLETCTFFCSIRDKKPNQDQQNSIRTMV